MEAIVAEQERVLVSDLGWWQEPVRNHLGQVHDVDFHRFRRLDFCGVHHRLWIHARSESGMARPG